VGEGLKRRCVRCKKGTEECIIHPNFWLCDWCDEKPSQQKRSNPIKQLKEDLDALEWDDHPTQPGLGHGRYPINAGRLLGAKPLNLPLKPPPYPTPMPPADLDSITDAEIDSFFNDMDPR
jgi:hypothetical protein